MKHLGTFIAGVIFAVLAVLFLLEALDVWSLSLADFWLLGPLLLVVIGVVVVVNAVTRKSHDEAP